MKHKIHLSPDRDKEAVREGERIYMKKDEDEKDVMKTDSEEPEWFDEPELEEPETVSSDTESEEPEWFDEPELEEPEIVSSDTESEEPEWFDEAEPEGSETAESTPEESEAAESAPEQSKSVESAPEQSKSVESAPEESDAAPAFDSAVDVEGDDLAGIVAAGMLEEPVQDTYEREKDTAAEKAGMYSESVDDSDYGDDDEYYDDDDDYNYDDRYYDGPGYDDDENDKSGGKNYEEEMTAHRDKKKRRRRLIIGISIPVAALVVAYFCVGFYFRDRYLPGTVISGIECDYMTPEEVEEIVQSQIDQYTIQITEREGGVETLNGSDFGLHLVYGDALDEILENQGPFLWPKAYFGEDTTYDLGRAVDWDEEEFLAEINALNCMDMNQMIDPADAKILYSEEQQEYYIKPAEYGTHTNTENVVQTLTNSVSSLATTVDLDEADCYEAPNVTEESTEMSDAVNKLNQMISADITYDMIDIDNIHISKDQMREWIVMDDNFNVYYNDDAIWQFIADFAAQYDTRDKTHYLHTSWGGTATADNSGYGWQLDQEGEFNTLKENLEEGATVVREPVWAHTAKSHGENDYGNTYVEINLTRQHLFFYKDGQLVIDSDFVSGRMTKSRVTDAGIYYVYYKQTDAVLKGEDYETPVSYWMPFNGGEGMHDATWRGSFGGTIYINSGSHGCINLPYSAAETIYNNINIGDCVFVYWEDGLTTELADDTATSSSSSSSGGSSQSSSGSSVSNESTDTYYYDYGGGNTGGGGNGGGDNGGGGGGDNGSDNGGGDNGGDGGGDNGGGDNGGGDSGGGDDGGGDNGGGDNGGGDNGGGDTGGGDTGGEEGGE